MFTSKRQKLIRQAAEAYLIVHRHLALLLDGYDFYINRYEADTPSRRLELADVQDSIKILGEIPGVMANRMDEWRYSRPHPMSADEFEVEVLNEINMHMNSLAMFMYRKELDMSDFNAGLVGEAFNTIKAANKVLG